MSELFERMKTRRASGDTKFKGNPSTGMEGRGGGMSQDLGWGITRLVNWGVKRPYAYGLWVCRCFACFPTGFRALRPLFFLIHYNFPKMILNPLGFDDTPPPPLSTGEMGRFSTSFFDSTRIDSKSLDTIIRSAVEFYTRNGVVLKNCK